MQEEHARVSCTYPFVPTDRDVDIIKTVARMRCVTSEQITRLLFPAQEGHERTEKITSQAKKRLTKLSRERYLSQVTRLHAPALYWLDTKGLRYLQDAGVVSPDLRLYPTERDVTPAWLSHHLKNIDVWIEIELSCQKHGFTLVDFADQRAMKRTHRGDKVRIKVGEQEEDTAVIPDAFFHIKNQVGRDYHHLLEVDMGTETLEATTKGARDISRKVRGYLAYMPKTKFDHESLYEKRYGVNPGRVLWIVSGEKRLRNIKELIFTLGGRMRYWLTTFERFSAADILTAPIWDIVTETEKPLDPQPLIQ